MKSMILSDLLIYKRNGITTLLVYLAIGIFMMFMMDNPIAVSAFFVAAIPLAYLFAIISYDEQNGWQAYRLTFPVSAKQIVYGRYIALFIILMVRLVVGLAFGYLSIAVMETFPVDPAAEAAVMAPDAATQMLFGSMIAFLGVLLAVIITMPLIMRFGLAGGMRFVPVGVFLVAFGLIALVTWVFGSNDILSTVFTQTDTLGLIMVVATLVMLGFYALSAVVTARLYAGREF